MQKDRQRQWTVQCSQWWLVGLFQYFNGLQSSSAKKAFQPTQGSAKTLGVLGCFPVWSTICGNSHFSSV